MPRRSGCYRYPTRPTLRIEVADPQHALVLYGSPADMGAEDSWERSIWQFVVPRGSIVGASCCSGTATPMARTGRVASAPGVGGDCARTCGLVGPLREAYPRRPQVLSSGGMRRRTWLVHVFPAYGVTDPVRRDDLLSVPDPIVQVGRADRDHRARGEALVVGVGHPVVVARSERDPPALATLRRRARTRKIWLRSFHAIEVWARSTATGQDDLIRQRSVVQVHLGPPLQFLASLTFTAVTHRPELP